ncbi:GNAT family N-acetyltransferase [Flavobacterium turcicum]|uniref:GNAT family N-acetyltransferase n=1 Tax=Flavobacterium turcicum TaxID=2764718 RepID=A0ABR7JDI9_9FLAO|nr:GNAT family N-acetyltransferase [Flavobacterium turcicum]MBC5862418.1 GNAT family N-acetyltransferase [Flavobacterium turcicum]NHL01149.1 GNAT family N-acetyltransferase [Flavobacterium turcicum]
MIHFKPIDKQDVNTVSTLMVDFYAIDGYPIAIETTRELLDQFIDNPELGKCWLIYREEQVVGYLILTFVFSFEYQGKIAFLDELFVTETARGKGIGGKAIDFIKAESPKLSLKLIYLEVEPHNIKAQKLYLASGFEMHNRKLMRLKTD